MLELGPTPKILITRLSAIGDCIHTLPMVSALRRRFPGATIVWATQAAPASLIENHFAVDKVIRIDRRWMKRWSSICALRRELRTHRFDLAIDPQSLTKSAMLGWLSGARRRIGFGRGQGREVAPVLANVRITPRLPHVVERYLELLSPLGITGVNAEFALPRYELEDSKLPSWLAQHAPPRFALLNPGAGWESKRWPHERYAIVARSLFKKHGIPSVILWAGPEELSWAQAIEEKSRGCSMLAPSTSLQELAELCRQATLFVGSDTGPMHLAAATGTPCVAMYGPTKISECGPYGDGHEPIQVRYQSGNSSERRGNDNRAMKAISSDLVCLACDRIIGRQAEKAA